MNIHLFRSFALWMGLGAAASLYAAPPLSMAEAERLALAQDPEIRRLETEGAAFEEQAVADGQLPDPRLRLSAMNLPTDSFSLSQEAMTQLQVGIEQRFPPGRTLRLRQQKTRTLGAVQKALAEKRRREVRREVRRAWLDLYEALGAEAIVRSNRRLFAQLVRITQSYYAAGRQNQQDVIRAQLELSRLEDRLTHLRTAIETARARLARWVGEEAARRPLPSALPELPEPGALERIRTALENHPLIRAQKARIAESQTQVAIAREQYKPGWMISLGYGLRSGENPDGGKRADFLTAMVTVDLPIFREKRQDKRLAASQRRLEAARLALDDLLLELQRMLEAEYARFQRFKERKALFEKRLLPEAEQNTIASLNAYQSEVTDFTTLIRARITELDLRIQALEVAVAMEKAKAGLLYLTGEPS